MKRAIFYAALFVTITAISVNASLAHLPSSIAHSIAAHARSLKAELTGKTNFDHRLDSAFEALALVDLEYQALGNNLNDSTLLEERSEVLLSNAQVALSQAIDLSSSMPASMLRQLTDMISQNDRLIRCLM